MQAAAAEPHKQPVEALKALAGARLQPVAEAKAPAVEQQPEAAQETAVLWAEPVVSASSATISKIIRWAQLPAAGKSTSRHRERRSPSTLPAPTEERNPCV